MGEVHTLCSRKKAHVHAFNRIYLLTDIKAPEIGHIWRPRLNLCILIDRSGSMYGDKLLFTRDVVSLMIDSLLPEDIVSIVMYDDVAEKLLYPANPLNKDLIKDRLQRIVSRGGTDLFGGLSSGIKEAERASERDTINHVVLISDGSPSAGSFDLAEILSLSEDALKRNIRISTISVGDDSDRDVLIRIAEKGGGTPHHIKSDRDIPAIIEKELEDLFSTYAYAVKLNLFAHEEACITGSPGRENRKFMTGNDLTVELGNIRSMEKRSVVTELVIHKTLKGKKKIATVTVEFDTFEGKVTHSQDIYVDIVDENIEIEIPDTRIMETVKRLISCCH
ncbi:hypothetical protein CUJ83_11775 [Methanocella sp. CWC-04]|uniref:VWFA domain-containing protein n=1 Tax=Methanooceanicella nereidis TaxID=2052831 RepID=A0AAP2W834_9EURY|nr:VWA domain-containing protein [Methanocella sp. CWC-04]MCD1295676.1 hypothetical protein [Methanocella sp. CWC-04]